jgi:F-type H+-transporting ATPase subunit gamma
LRRSELQRPALVVGKMKEFDARASSSRRPASATRVSVSCSVLGGKVVSHVIGLGDTPHLEKLIGPVKVQLDAYMKGEIDALYIGYTRFINTMKQEPVFEQLLPLSGEAVGSAKTKWDYVYEPEAKAVIDDLLIRYVEALIYQAVAENMASEQSARMVAMKSASDNAKTVIGELKLVYNKARQAAITKELSEIVSGAAAV